MTPTVRPDPAPAAEPDPAGSADDGVTDAPDDETEREPDEAVEPAESPVEAAEPVEPVEADPGGARAPGTGPKPRRRVADDAPLIPGRSSDDSDVGWERGDDSNDQRLRDDVPPHW